jgi:hypothetical protein
MDREKVASEGEPTAMAAANGSIVEDPNTH